VSLIGDALRKARREAAERDVERRGVLFSAHIADRPARSGLGLGLAVGATIALVATIGGGLTVWWLLGRGEPPASIAATGPAAPVDDPLSGATPGPASMTGPASASVDGGSGGGDVGDGVPGGSAVGASPPRSATAPGAAERAAGSARDATDARGDSRPPVAEPVPQETGSEPATGFAGRENGDDVYIMEAEVGGVRLSLDYIVFRAEDPFVEINGVELHVGGVVAGFRVKEIGGDRVSLTDGRRTIILRTP
jgi:hypothetical protein